MSYTRLVGYAHHPQAKSEQFSDEIILFVVERGAAEMTHRGCVIDRRAVVFVNEGALARFPDAVRHHVHRTIQRNFRPLFRARRAIFHFCLAPIMREQLVRRRAFRAKIPLANWTLGIALDRNQLAVFVTNELSATDAAVRANRAGDACAIGARMHRARFVRHRLQAGAIFALADLPNERPSREQRSERCHVV
jgi:hypothetical protein